MQIITLIILVATLTCCKPTKHAPARINARGYYRQGGSLTIRLDSLGVIDSSTARFVEAVRRRFNIDSNKIKYEVRNTQHRQ